MKKIYIVLSYTGTILSRVVKLYTQKEFSHVSISLDKGLRHMYSFGRLHAYNPFIVGFVQESPDYGTFKRFSNTTTEIYSLKVSNQDYWKISRAIYKMERDRDEYAFNMLGLLMVAGNYHLKRNRHFYCAEFVKYVLDCSSLQLNLPEIVKPDDFLKVDGIQLEYKGKLKDYSSGLSEQEVLLEG